MKIIKKIKSFFTKEELSKKIDLSLFKINDLIELEYVDPKTIGIISKNTLTFTRLNDDEINDRIIKGTIENIVWNNDLKTNVVYIKTFKKINFETVVRQFVFLEYEIKSIRKLR